MDLEKPLRYEPVTDGEVEMIIRTLGGLQSIILGLDAVDLRAGAGILGDKKKCLWLTNGRRVTFSLGGGTLVASTTKEPDPLADRANREVTP